MMILDVTIVNVALVDIKEHLSANVTGLQWIVDGYALVFASFLLTGGALGDRKGSRTVFLAGLALFTLASTLCSLAPTLLVLQIAHQMWKGDEKPYQGKQYQLGRPLNSPSSVQKPHPPILIGGAGERKTLRLVAQYGDACNFSLTSLGLSEAQRKLSILREHCQSIGRPYTDIEKTIIKRIHLTRDGREKSLTPAAAIAYFRELAAMGIDQAIVSLPNVADLAPFDLFATEIIPAVEQIEVAGR